MSRHVDINLPANSTFLPVLDDLLSPDLRPTLFPVQTPTETPTTEHRTFLNSIFPPPPPIFPTSIYVNETKYKSHHQNKDKEEQNKAKNEESERNLMMMMNGDGDGEKEKSNEAASKIQNWWKDKKKSDISDGLENVHIDQEAENAKHIIRHNRTEDHIRYLEAEVSRLKSSLATERKLRLLQFEAIRSLWNQVQRLSSQSTAESLMTRSTPPDLGAEVLNNASDADLIDINSEIKN